MEDFVDVERVRVFLAYKDEKTVRRLTARGLPHYRLNGHLRFRLSEVSAWVAENAGSGKGADVLPLPVRRSA